MIRTKKSKAVDLILCSDFHLREDVPVCYVGDFWNDQWEAVDFVSNLQKKYDCPVFHAGDLFDHWKPSPHLLSTTIHHIPNKFFTVYGQHDLPQHNLNLSFKCGTHCLLEANKIRLFSVGHFGDVPNDIDSWAIDKRDGEYDEYGYIDGEGSYMNPMEAALQNPAEDIIEILVWHKFNYQGKLPWPGCTSPTANKLLKDYPQYDLIVTGDNHKSFVETYEGRLLVNPGSLMRQDADQIDFHPCVYLYHAEDNTVTKVELPFKEGVISREHIEKVNQKNERLEAYINRLDLEFGIGKVAGSEGGYSFDEELEIFQQKNKVEKSVMEIIYKSIELKLK
jgi:DNA repair exonuclease SbcCD nuclease subunit